MYQHARYLMISSSRPGNMPANLQGLWNPYNNPPWRSDYHTDVNVEMNYWFVASRTTSVPPRHWAWTPSIVRKWPL